MMKNISFKKLKEPPIRLRCSEVIAVQSKLRIDSSSYVFEDSDSGSNQAWELIQAIINIEKKRALRGGPFYERLKLDTEYMERVKQKVIEAFNQSRDFHMQMDLETYVESTNLPLSRFQKQGEVVFFNLNYFSQADEDKKVAIESCLGLEKKVSGTTQEVEYSRIGGDIFFKIPFESYLNRLFPWLEDDPNFTQAVEHSMRDGSYTVEFSTPSDKNSYKFQLSMPNVNNQWLREVSVVNGALLGASVTGEVYLSQKARKCDFEESRQRDIERITGEIELIDMGDSHYSNPPIAKASLQKQLVKLLKNSDELFAEFMKARKKDLRYHRKNLRESDERYGVDNKVAMPWKGTTSYLYLANPVLLSSVSLREVADYRAAEKFLKSFFLSS
jgi:hypothetical protein